MGQYFSAGAFDMEGRTLLLHALFAPWKGGLDSVRPLGAQLPPLLPLPPLLIQNPLSILGHTGHAGGGGADLSMPPRNFSLSDLTLDQLHADGLDMDMQ